jgi:hypothetical protein
MASSRPSQMLLLLLPRLQPLQWLPPRRLGSCLQASCQ